MKFGGMVATKIDDWQIFPYLESLGYQSGWAPDSQMIWSDCYATLALAAWHTSTLRLGTGVAIAGTRAAPVTAHSIASINKIAPGRVFLGIATGHTAMRLMGQDPVAPSRFRDYLRVVRGLLQGDEVEYGPAGEEKPIRFLDRELGCVNVEQPVPIYVAANGPRALMAAGAYGDGRICAGNEPVAVLERNLGRIRQGAADAGRALPSDFHAAVMTYACVLRPGETMASERVIDETGAEALATLHFWYEIYLQRGTDDFISDKARGVWEDYKRYVAAEMPAERRHLMLHRGHCAFMAPEERRFVTPELIEASGGLVGGPDEIIERLRALEGAGLNEVVLLPPYAPMRANFKDFADQVITKY